MPGHMTVTDPDVPDPLNDPRTLQADPGAYGESGTGQVDEPQREVAPATETTSTTETTVDGG